MATRETPRPAPDHDPELQPITNADDWELVTDATSTSMPPQLAAVISVRLDPQTAQLIGQAARAKGLTQAEFMRRATRKAAEAALTSPLAKHSSLG